MKLAYIRVGYSKEVEVYVYNEEMVLKKGRFYIIETIHENDFGYYLGDVNNQAIINDYNNNPDKYFKVLRVPTNQDIQKRKEKKLKSKECFEIALQKIEEFGLPIKLVNTYYFFEGNKILFNFYSETRVDFRELVKNLASLFKTRIELHQIGIRDFAQHFDLYGICGRETCCSTIKTHKYSVSLKAAKEQNLNIKASKLSGICGRLMCCLNYECENYRETGIPNIGDEIIIDNISFFVKEVDRNKKTIHLFNENDEFKEISFDEFQKVGCQNCSKNMGNT
ncbi:MAG TPA: regulatory iron-sulfur-containing complex subunit RicT [Spirochaetota bacterium]|nr:regulatory iron-sulfur-containing complex subunit RicT [Spirochaetota bacterium]HOM38140.1 regulatory iron-sulfur-containing complex subunit RicT [Spirochaetota bacterium]HPQ48642.1 regulatory iron-sulfur-containing complex subunit RicT [Spirochaetota bacterium]